MYTTDFANTSQQTDLLPQLSNIDTFKQNTLKEEVVIESKKETPKINSREYSLSSIKPNPPLMETRRATQETASVQALPKAILEIRRDTEATHET